MVSVKYYDGILRAQKRTQAAPPEVTEFRFQDHEDHSFQAWVLQKGFERPRLWSGFLRTFFPVLRSGRFALVTRYDDVREILDRDDVFEAPFGLEMAEVSGGADFVLGLPRGPRYDRMQHHMRAVFHPDDPQRIIAPMAREMAERVLVEAKGRINAVRDYITRIPTRIVEAHFGIPIPDENAFAEWCFAISYLCFADPQGVPKTRRIALAGADRLRTSLDVAIARSKAAGAIGDTIVDRLVRLQAETPDGPADAEIRSILMGTITGFIPTNAVAGAHMLKVLLDRPDAMEQTRLAALDNDTERLWDCLVEAMRFLPLNPGPFRYALRDHTLTHSGRVIREGATVLASTQSAMLDGRSIEKPQDFRPGRPLDANVLFGHGLHRCFGIAIAKAQLTATFGTLLRERDLRPAVGRAGKLQRLGPFPTELFVAYGAIAPAAIEQAMITVCVPIAQGARIEDITAVLEQLGNPARAGVQAALDRSGRIHFLSMHVVEGDQNKGEPAHLVLEVTADGDAQEVLRELAQTPELPLRALLLSASALPEGADVGDVAVRHQLDVGYQLGKVCGLNFNGLPGFSVRRIQRERELERVVADAVATATVPHERQSLPLLERVRAEVRRRGTFDWAFRPDPAPFLEKRDTLPANPIGLVRIFATPTIMAIPALIAAVSSWLFYFGALHAPQDSAVNMAAKAALAGAAGVLFAVILIAATALTIFLALRRKEKSDIPEDRTPDAKIVQDIMERENRCAQNHMIAVPTMKPGVFRALMLRYGFWVIVRHVVLFYRPGFMQVIGTIHSGRWFKIPKTDTLVFTANYAGSWESYLEDFITTGAWGLSAVWSNCKGFPRTKALFFQGGADGDRFKRWQRRQQRPTLFWYSAYPDLTPERIRINAAIRDGLARADSETEALAWRSLFASTPAAAGLIEDHEVQSLAFSGMGKLLQAECIAVALPSASSAAKAWLHELNTGANGAGGLTFGDRTPTDRATFIALSAQGLRKLGVTEDEAKCFPPAFAHGMGVDWRARVLGDQGASAPQTWRWGGADNAADAVIFIYARDAEGLEDAKWREVDRIGRYGLKIVTTIKTQLTYSRLHKPPSIEPFGFADGLSQPIVRGSRRWRRNASELHSIEPGEMLLGYPDARGYYPPTFEIEAKNDASNDLPLLPELMAQRWPEFTDKDKAARRDLGRNGTYLVVRQLEQDVDGFNAYLKFAANDVARRYPDLDVPRHRLEDWIGAKMVGRWKNGSSLIDNPDGAASRKADNDFLLGADDPQGLKCPFGAHIRRANPRESVRPGDKQLLAITNRHRIFRVGRPYVENGSQSARGLLFMCVNADIERQFEFIQQTWISAPTFHGLQREVDAITATTSEVSAFTIPTPYGSISLPSLSTFVTVRGGGYFFLPSRSALRFFARR